MPLHSRRRKTDQVKAALAGRGTEAVRCDPALAARARQTDADTVVEAYLEVRQRSQQRLSLTCPAGELILGQRSADLELDSRKPDHWAHLLSRYECARVADCAAMIVYWDHAPEWDPSEVSEWWDERIFRRPQPEATAEEVAEVLLGLGYTPYRIRRRLRL